MWVWVFIQITCCLLHNNLFFWFIWFIIYWVLKTFLMVLIRHRGGKQRHVSETEQNRWASVCVCRGKVDFASTESIARKLSTELTHENMQTIIDMQVLTELSEWKMKATTTTAMTAAHCIIWMPNGMTENDMTLVMVMSMVIERLLWDINASIIINFLTHHFFSARWCVSLWPQAHIFMSFVWAFNVHVLPLLLLQRSFAQN